MNTEAIHLSAQIPKEYAGYRLDSVLVKLFPEHSRSRLQNWIKENQVTVDQKILRPKDKVKGGEWVEICATVACEQAWSGENIPLNIIHEDDSLLIINKPAGLVVHPAVGNRSGTLVNALLHHAPALQQLPRAGIVHRLDKDTTGLLVIAKTLAAHTHLVQQLQQRQFKRIYQAIVAGIMIAGTTIDAPIGRHPRQRTLMAVVNKGKPAVTHVRVLEKFNAHTFVQVQLETGRTHQIRVHMAHIHYPIVGDQTYGGRLKLPTRASDELTQTLQQFKRQALHAKTLGLTHPQSLTAMEWSCPLPDDMDNLLQRLRENTNDDK